MRVDFITIYAGAGFVAAWGFPKESPLALAPWGMLSQQCPCRRAAKIPIQSGEAPREPHLNLCPPTRAFRSWHFSGDAGLMRERPGGSLRTWHGHRVIGARQGLHRGRGDVPRGAGASHAQGEDSRDPDGYPRVRRPQKPPPWLSARIPPRPPHGSARSLVEAGLARSLLGPPITRPAGS